MAVKGVARFYKQAGKNHIVTVQTEHKCVLDSCRSLQEDGFEVTYLGVKSDGVVDLEVSFEVLDPKFCNLGVLIIETSNLSN